MVSPSVPLPLSPSGLLAMPPIVVAHISLLVRPPVGYTEAPAQSRGQ